MSTALNLPSATDTFLSVRRVLEMICRDENLDSILEEIERWVDTQIPEGRCFIHHPPPHSLQQQRAAGPADSLVYPILGTGRKLFVHFVESPARSEHYHQVAAFAAELAATAIRQQKLSARVEAGLRQDPLTGLLNRGAVQQTLDQAIQAAKASARKVTVLFIGLDRFKPVNDLYGHAAGDQLLLEVGSRLRLQLGGDDHAARIGGDEFAVILCNPQSQHESEMAAQRILDSLRAPHQIDGQALSITASCGASIFPDHAVAAAELFVAAGTAMSQAKRHGRNQIVLFAPDNQRRASDRLHLEHALGLALANHEFQLVYQPLVSVEGKLDGLEVLLSWNHPQRGRIAPKHFIPVAEETGLIVPIGNWVLQEACLQGTRWLNSGHPGLSISVNVSAVQFGRADFFDTVAAALTASQFPADRLELEVTESFVMQDVEAASLRMAALRKLGIRIAIDDFGTGYSSLSYLSRLPVDTLKIDQSFVRNIQDPSGSLPVVQSIVKLAHNLNLIVVAEGVETVEELDLLRLVGCDRVQGYLYGSALDANAVEALLRKPGGLVEALVEARVAHAEAEDFAQ